MRSSVSRTSCGMAESATAGAPLFKKRSLGGSPAGVFLAAHRAVLGADQNREFQDVCK